MKQQFKVCGFVLLLSVCSIHGQANQAQRLFLPLLDRQSQSNVDVQVVRERSCPTQYTNALSNTNLFTLEQQGLIKELFVKYNNVTTNSGPPGSVLVYQFKTNFVVQARNRNIPIERWVARYQYTNSEAYEEVTIGKLGTLSAKFRTRTNDGYDVSINPGDGSILQFIEIKHDLRNGLLVFFYGTHEQGRHWDYRHANFADGLVTEYRQYTNGMLLGKFLMWNPRNGNLTMKAEFKEPYDWMKNYRQPEWESRASTPQDQAQACISNLRFLDGAKEQWALENQKAVGAPVNEIELLPYLRNHTLPVCPAGGDYTINAVGLTPACSRPGHALPK